MTNDEYVFEKLTTGTSLPGARMTWGPRSCTPPLPYFTYQQEERGDVYGDNANVARVPHYSARFFMEEHDEALVGRIREAVHSIGTYRMAEDYDEDAEAFAVTFHFPLVRRDKE